MCAIPAPLKRRTLGQRLSIQPSAAVVGNSRHSVPGMLGQASAGAYRGPDHLAGQDELNTAIQLTADRRVVRRHRVPLSEPTRGERAG